ncbi:MAG TPA: HEAT repeat domain-containing protein [Roseivirga sp.]
MIEMDDKYMSLITEYLDGTLEGERKIEFDRCVKEGQIDMTEVEELSALNAQMTNAEKPEPSDRLSELFYQRLSEEKSKLNQTNQWQDIFSQISSLLFGSNKGRLAFGFAVLMIGLVAGRLFSGSIYNTQIDRLSSEMADMKEMMMMAMLDGESVTERLKGVQMSNGLVTKNQEVTDALFLTLNNDENTNVRLAALATLAEYAKDPAIREGLIKSIANQESPLVQVALAELMVELQESQALNEFENILNAETTPEDVKSALRQNLDKIM